MVFPAIIALHWSLLDSMLCDNMNDALVIKTDLKAIIREDRYLSYIGEEAKISEKRALFCVKYWNYVSARWLLVWYYHSAACKQTDSDNNFCCIQRLPNSQVDTSC